MAEDTRIQRALVKVKEGEAIVEEAAPTEPPPIVSDWTHD
jgi:hypothetical protein